MNAESALARGKRVDRDGIPTMKVKITELGIRRLAAPRVRPCLPLAVDGAVGGVLPLRFGGERLPCPARIGRCLSLAHVYGPVERNFVKRNFFKHAAPDPAAAFLFPECGMRNPLRALPVPGVVVPESTRVIAAGGDEVEILPVCHLVAIDLESGNFDGVSFILIVPTKAVSTPLKA